MTEQLSRFEDFAVGDYVTFSRTFGPDDITAFARISGDHNPLHHDPGYAERSEFGGTIVPLHLTAAPLSMIAGMVFPGLPSLYLSHELKALEPVRYDVPVEYSAKLVHVNQMARVLVLRVLALQQGRIVLRATMNVSARLGEFPRRSEGPPLRRPTRKALVTGAAGGIGSAVAAALARAGWSLVLHCRHPSAATERLGERITALGANVSMVEAELETAEGRAGLAAAVRRDDELSHIVHCASPGPEASLEKLVAVNYLALKELAEAAAHGLLLRQEGGVVLIGTTALEYAPLRWAHYMGAKAMAVQYLNAFAKAYGGVGVRGLTVAPGYVATEYSKQYRTDATPTLLPEEVAEAVVTELSSIDTTTTFIALEPAGARRGSFGFQAPLPSADRRPAVEQRSAIAPEQSTATIENEVARLVRRLFNVDSSIDVRNTGLGLVAGWDSLGHLGLVVEIERLLGITLTAAEMHQTERFADLVAICSRKRAGSDR